MLAGSAARQHCALAGLSVFNEVIPVLRPRASECLNLFHYARASLMNLTFNLAVINQSFNQRLLWGVNQATGLVQLNLAVDNVVLTAEKIRSNRVNIPC